MDLKQKLIFISGVFALLISIFNVPYTVSEYSRKYYNEYSSNYKLKLENVQIEYHLVFMPMLEKEDRIYKQGTNSAYIRSFERKRDWSLQLSVIVGLVIFYSGILIMLKPKKNSFK